MKKSGLIGLAVLCAWLGLAGTAPAQDFPPVPYIEVSQINRGFQEGHLTVNTGVSAPADVGPLVMSNTIAGNLNTFAEWNRNFTNEVMPGGKVFQENEGTQLGTVTLNGPGLGGPFNYSNFVVGNASIGWSNAKP